MSSLPRTESRTVITILSLLLGTVALLVAPQVFSQTGVFAGYGYGYGDCEVDGPIGLTARFLTKQNRNKIAFRWNAVSFEECDDTVDYYQLQVKYPNGTLVESWSDISGLRKRVFLNQLKKNQPYVFRVRAWSVGGERSAWSLYKAFRTKPAEPKSISIDAVNNNSVTASWSNVARSKKLQKYRVQLKRGQKTVAKTNVRKGLKKARAQVTITGLQSDTKYKLQVRSVFSKALRSPFKQKKFRTAP